MAIYYHKLSHEKYSNFLAEGRHDPIIKEPFKSGDKVVICSNCKSAFLLNAWIAFDKKHCNQTNTEPLLNGNRGKRYGRFEINSETESSEDSEVLKNIWNIVKVILLFPLLILKFIGEFISGIFEFSFKIIEWIFKFILNLIGATIVIGFITLVISGIFDLDKEQMSMAVLISMVLILIVSFQNTNEDFIW